MHLLAATPGSPSQFFSFENTAPSFERVGFSPGTRGEPVATIAKTLKVSAATIYRVVAED